MLVALMPAPEAIPPKEELLEVTKG